MVTQDHLNNLDFEDSPKRLRIEKRRGKYDRRRIFIVVMDGHQILKEYWPASEENMKRAQAFWEGYQMAQTVWCPRETLDKWKKHCAALD